MRYRTGERDKIGCWTEDVRQARPQNRCRAAIVSSTDIAILLSTDPFWMTSLGRPPLQKYRKRVALTMAFFSPFIFPQVTPWSSNPLCTWSEQLVERVNERASLLYTDTTSKLRVISILVSTFRNSCRGRNDGDLCGQSRDRLGAVHLKMLRTEQRSANALPNSCIRRDGTNCLRCRLL